MKKLGYILLICAILVSIVYVVKYTDTVDYVASYLLNETDSSTKDFSTNWYYSQLIDSEKDIYLKLATAIDCLQERVVLIGDISTENIKKAYEAFLKDNPQVFYLKSEYIVNITEISKLKKLEIKLEYIYNTSEIKNYISTLDRKVDSILSQVLTSGMTPMEIEIALHDYLVKNVKYYDYYNIDDILPQKHTAYEAIVNNEAVCDGFSKAFQILLGRCNIESILVTGSIKGSPHAWNKVKLDSNWYNVDVTSDACGQNRLVSHIYFNMTDDKFCLTHVIDDNKFSTPRCESNKMDYYICNNYEVGSSDNLKDKLEKIIENSKNKEVLEFRISDADYGVRDVVSNLYRLNFNNYKDRGITSISYYYVNNIFLTEK